MILNDTYELHGPIASGGMGSVWRAVHRRSGEPVAVKFLKERSTRERTSSLFLREVQALTRLDHPNVVHVFDYGEVKRALKQADVASGQHFVVMEYVDGADASRAGGPATWRELRLFLLVLLDALAHIHAREVYHLDLKPSNILLPRDRTLAGLKLTDFGTAHELAPLAAGGDMSDLGSFSGTPRYASPEQFVGAWRDFGPWTDLYALGCTTWELATGAPPFEAENIVSLASLHVHEPLPRFRPRFALPEGFGRWLHTLLSKSHTARFRTAAQAAAALLQLGAPAADDMDAEPPPRPTNQHARTWTLDLSLAQTVPRARFLSSRPVDSATLDVVEPQLVSASWRRTATDAEVAGLRNPRVFGIAQPPFVGRDETRDELWGQLRNSFERRELGVAILRGPAGVGKTRLAEWIGVRAAELGAANFVKVSLRGSMGGLAGIRAMLETSLSSWGLGPAALYQRAREQFRIWSCDPERADQMAAVVVAVLRPVGDDDEVPRQLLYTWRERTRFMRMLLDARTNQGPLVLLYDDIESAPEILLFVEQMCREPEDLPVYVMLTADDEAIAAKPVEATRLFGIAGERVRSWTLDPFAVEESQALVERFRLENQDAKALTKASSQTPLELILRLQQPRQDATLGELWGQQVDRVLAGVLDPESAWQALEMLAAVGESFSVDEWSEVCHHTGVVNGGEVLERLVRAEIVRPTSVGWTFQHRTLTTTITKRSQAGGRWRGFHLAWSDVVRGREVQHHKAERIARHYVEAGEFEAALPLLFEAAEEVSVRGDALAARVVLTWYRSAMDHMKLPPEDPRRARALLTEARNAWFEEDFVGMRTLLEEARAYCDPAAEPMLMSAILRGHAHLLEQVEGRGEEALELTHRALDYLVGDSPQFELERRIARAGLGAILHNLDRPCEALEQLEQALAGLALDQIDDFRLVAALKYQGDVLVELGRLDEAERYLQRALDIASDVRGRAFRSSCLASLADVHFARGDLREARAYNEEATNMASLAYSEHGRYSHLNLATISLIEGKDDEAARHLELARAGLLRGLHILKSAIRLLDAILAARRHNGSAFEEHVQALEAIWSRPVRFRAEAELTVVRMRGRLEPEFQARLEAIVLGAG